MEKYPGPDIEINTNALNAEDTSNNMLYSEYADWAGINKYVVGRKLRIKKHEAPEILRSLGFKRKKSYKPKTKEYIKYLIKDVLRCHIEIKPGGVYWHFDNH